MIKFKAPSKGSYRRGLRPLAKRLTTAVQVERRDEKIEQRRLSKAMAKVQTRVQARKEKKT